jgi:hypothetical protein
MKTSESRDPENPEPPPPPLAAEPMPPLIGSGLEPDEDSESTQRVRPGPLRHARSHWRRTALAGAVLLGLAAGTLLAVVPPRGLSGWLKKVLGRTTGEAGGGPETVSGMGRSLRTESRSRVPSPTAPIPRAGAATAAAEPSPPATRRVVRSAMAKAKSRGMVKGKKTYRKRAGRGRARLRGDSTVKVELF